MPTINACNALLKQSILRGIEKIDLAKTSHSLIFNYGELLSIIKYCYYVNIINADEYEYYQLLIEQHKLNHKLFAKVAM